MNVNSQERMNEKEKPEEAVINITDRKDINYWTKKLNTNPNSLKLAVQTVGPRVIAFHSWHTGTNSH